MRIKAAAPLLSRRFGIAHKPRSFAPHDDREAKNSTRYAHDQARHGWPLRSPCVVACAATLQAQSPTFPNGCASQQRQQRAGEVESRSRIRSTAATRGVLNQWQQQSAGRTDIRVAIDERTAQALVFAPPAVHAQIQQQLCREASAGHSPHRSSSSGQQSNLVTPNVGLALPGSAVLFQLRQLPAGRSACEARRLAFSPAAGDGRCLGRMAIASRSKPRQAPA